jgi:hypothetical protein
MSIKSILIASTALLSLTSITVAAEITVIEAPVIPMSAVTFPNGKSMELSVGYASGAFHMPGDAESDVYFITDRGPNIACEGDAEDLIGLNEDKMCAGDKDGKIFPIPDFDPTIYKITISADGKASIAEEMPLKGTDGKKLNGLSNILTKNPAEKAYSVEGKEMAQSNNGFDSESLVRLKDGTFWISDEYGASIAHVAADGTVLDRLVPEGIEGDYADASYPVHGKLPGIIMKRPLNRGIESIAVSPDEASLYFVMQSPLANPDQDAYKKSRTVRLFKFDIASEKVVGEYAYQIDTADSFVADNAKKPAKQNDVKISEMVATGADKLLVLERISKTTKLYTVDLSKGTTIPASFDDMATAPSLEQLKADELAASKVVPLEKTIAFNSDDHKDMPTKIEGVALINPTTLLLATDNDFGIAGDKTSFVKVVLDQALSN